MTMEPYREEVGRPLVGLGIAIMVLGILAMLAPLAAGLALAVVVGILFVLAGLAECWTGLRRETRGHALLGTALGALAILAGVLMIADPVRALASLTFVLAAYFFVRGAFQLMWLARGRERGWGWTLMDGIASILLAVIVWAQWPLSGLWSVGILAGVKMLFTGAAMVGLGQASRHVAGRMRKTGRVA